MWPTRIDYDNAIQNPKICFKTSTLKNGRVRKNSLGLPLGVSGAFATVYELNTGNKKYAVRCFVHQVTNQGNRYKELTRFFNGASINSLAEFFYLNEEILIRGNRYPILKMEWVSGMLLNEYIKNNLRNRDKLQRLAEEWKNVVYDLYKYRIAHGDLQHGNILIQKDGRIRLVDYDSFFIPALRNYPPDEAGHPNYQHPDRSQSDYYDENIDNFPALVIYLSLIALSADPRHWAWFNQDGEKLIFSSEDFKNPGKMRIWNVLRKTRDAKVIELTEKLLLFCKGPIENVPKLSTLLGEEIDSEAIVPEILPKKEECIPEPQKDKAPFVLPSFIDFFFKKPEPPSSFQKKTPVKKIFPTGLIPEFDIKPPKPAPNTTTCICGHVNKGDEIYCQKCVRALLTGNSWCSICENPIPRRAKFCIRCGTQQAGGY